MRTVLDGLEAVRRLCRSRVRPVRALIFPFLLGLVACTPPEDAVIRATRAGILLLGNGTEPEGLDPHLVTGVSEHRVLSSLFEGLVGLDPRTLEPVPEAVAERWEVSEDRLTYTFHLRPEATWSNGDPVRAQDFVYAYHRILRPDFGAPYAYILYPLKNAEPYNQNRLGTLLFGPGSGFPWGWDTLAAVDWPALQGLDAAGLEALRAGTTAFPWPDTVPPAAQERILTELLAYRQSGSPDLWEQAQVGVRALDERTLELRLEQPTPYLLGLLTHYAWFPVHPPTIERHGGMTRRDSPWTRPENLVGNGPFRLKDWRLNRRIAVEKRPDYWDAAEVQLNGIHFYPIDNQETEQRAFRRGGLHLTYSIPTHRLRWGRAHAPDAVRVDPYLGTYYYEINVTGPRAGLSAEQARARTVLQDPRVRQALALSVDREALTRFLEGGQEPALTFTPPGTAGYQPPTRLQPNSQEARRLLAAAGFPGGEGFPALQILYNTSDSHKAIAEILQETWRVELGIPVTLNNQEWKAYLVTRRTRDFDLARSGWIGDYIDPKTFLGYWISTSGNNNAGYNNPAYDALIAAANDAPTQAERYALFGEAETLLLQDLPCIPLYHYVSSKMIRPELVNWYPNYLDLHFYKQARVQLLSAP